MKNPQDIANSNPVHLNGSWKSMIAPFVGMLLVNTIIAIFVASFILMKIFGGGFDFKNEAILAIVLLALVVVLTWVVTYLIYFPKKWKTEVEIDLEKQLITLHGREGKIEHLFSEVEGIRYKATSSVFNTSYLYFITAENRKETPMVALSDATKSVQLFNLLKLRTKLNLVQ